MISVRMFKKEKYLSSNDHEKADLDLSVMTIKEAMVSSAKIHRYYSRSILNEGVSLVIQHKYLNSQSHGRNSLHLQL